MLTRKDIVSGGMGGEVANRSDSCKELFTVRKEGGIGWVGGTESIGEAGLDKCAYGIQFCHRHRRDWRIFFSLSQRVSTRVVISDMLGTKSMGTPR